MDAKGDATAKDVSVDGEAPFVLLSGGLAAGPVATAFRGPAPIFKGHPRRLSLGAEECQVSVDPAPSERGELRCALRFTCGQRRQSLARYAPCAVRSEPDEATGIDEIPLLLWAGDLDGDGRLDLLLDVSDHYNVQAFKLFLSSGAAADRLLGEGASFVSVGC